MVRASFGLAKDKTIINNMEQQLSFNVENNRVWVSGRSLYRVAVPGGQQADFTHFLRHRFKMLGLVQGVDYVEVKGWRETPNSRALIEFRITIEAAYKVGEYTRSAKVLKLIDDYRASINDSAVAKQEISTQRSQLEIEDSISANTTQQPCPGSASNINQSNTGRRTNQLLDLIQQVLESESPDVDDDFKQQVQSQLSDINGRLMHLEKNNEILSRVFGIIQSSFNSGLTISTNDFWEAHSKATKAAEEVVYDTVPTIIYPTTREKLVKLVTASANAQQVPIKDIWGHLYERLNFHYNFSAIKTTVGKEQYLDAVVRSGQLDNLYGLALNEYKEVARSLKLIE